MARLDRPQTETGERPVLDSRIDELLVACLTEAPPPDLSARLTRLPAREWEMLAALADWHRVAPLLFKRLRDGAIPCAIPDEASTRLRDSYQRTAFQNMSRLRELARLLGALRKRGIDVMLLKGAHLVTSVYGDPALRDMKDVDILVRQDDLADAYRVLMELAGDERADIEALIELSSRRHHHLPPIRIGSAGPVEMHWRITLPGEPVTIDMNDIWARSRETRIAGAQAWALAPDDLLLHLSLHAALQHRFRMRLRHLCDIAMALSRFRNEIDWDRFTSVANATGASRFVYCTLRVAETVLGAPVPTEGVHRLARGAADEAIVPVVQQYFLAASLELPVAFRKAREARGLAEKANIVLNGIAPPPARLRAMYGLPPGARSVYLYYPIRIADLLARRGRVLLEMARGSARFQLTLRREDAGKKIDRWVGTTT